MEGGGIMIVIQILKQNSVKIEIPEMLILNLILYGAGTNHVDRILGNFDPPPPMWTILLNSCY